MTPNRRFSTIVLLSAAIATLPQIASAASFGATPPFARAVQDTTFTPSGSYTLDLAVGGQAMTMALTVEKKSDGSFAGLFKHAELGEFATTSFKVDGRKMVMEIVTPGGAGSVMLTVSKENTVEGAWSMEGDGSKVSGKKTG
jgi:hypothetical protein